MMPLLCPSLLEIAVGDKEDGGKAWLGFGASPGLGWHRSQAGRKKPEGRCGRQHHHHRLGL